MKKQKEIKELRNKRLHLSKTTKTQIIPNKKKEENKKRITLVDILNKVNGK